MLTGQAHRMLTSTAAPAASRKAAQSQGTRQAKARAGTIESARRGRPPEKGSAKQSPVIYQSMSIDGAGL
jgi:hypothetical protein